MKNILKRAFLRCVERSLMGESTIGVSTHENLKKAIHEVGLRIQDLTLQDPKTLSIFFCSESAPKPGTGTICQKPVQSLSKQLNAERQLDAVKTVTTSCEANARAFLEACIAPHGRIRQRRLTKLAAARTHMSTDHSPPGMVPNVSQKRLLLHFVVRSVMF